jgi:hypothetical protein
MALAYKLPDENYNDRPTFYYKNNKKKPIRAGGILFYRLRLVANTNTNTNTNTNQYDFLLMYNTWRKTYEDLGGRTSEGDTCIQDTIAREIEEESNKIFKRDDIKKRLKNQSHVYIPNCKYLLYFLKATDEEAQLKKSDFGKLEIYDNLERTISWLSSNKILSNKFPLQLNIRMANPATYYRILDILDGIYD